MDPNQNMQQGNAVQPAVGGAKKTASAILVLALVIVGGWYLYDSGMFKRGVENAPELTREQLVGEAPISASLESAIEKHKKEILDRVSSGIPLTVDEREALGKTMLMEAHLYHFTDAETTAIFESLKPPQQ